jgi:hypothetical protein
MHFDVVLLSRIQFAFVVSFHIIFPSFTIGLAAWLATIEAVRLSDWLRRHFVWLDHRRGRAAAMGRLWPASPSHARVVTEAGCSAFPRQTEVCHLNRTSPALLRARIDDKP